MQPTQPPAQPVDPTVRHPLLRNLLVTVAQVAIPIAEAILEAWLASKGIKLPPFQGGSNASNSGSASGAAVSGPVSG